MDSWATYSLESFGDLFCIVSATWGPGGENHRHRQQVTLCFCGSKKKTYHEQRNRVFSSSSGWKVRDRSEPSGAADGETIVVSIRLEICLVFLNSACVIAFGWSMTWMLSLSDMIQVKRADAAEKKKKKLIN